MDNGDKLKNQSNCMDNSENPDTIENIDKMECITACPDAFEFSRQKSRFKKVNTVEY